ncbi:HEPN domain-containing protein [Embleya sp. NBC_00888]|uniref:HEPN domain-containing protein n=1 Tax=Embleya sp. NBC_00888 TaxID=2975960 RepID=UPI00386DE275|nr:HEPN domain-containing protein [Embleya sp. NBC_00888]
MATYDRLRTDVDTLLNYHPAIVDQKSGRPPGDTGPLLRAAIVLIYTAWENYFENVIEETFNKILTHIDDDHTLLPHHLRDVVAKHAQKKNPWDIVGNGWQTVARDHVALQIAALNTPNATNVELFSNQFLGIPGLLGKLKWKGHFADRIRIHLDSLTHDIRGEIVHKGQTPGPLNLGGVRDWTNFVTRLAELTDAAVSREVVRIYGFNPWP